MFLKTYEYDRNLYKYGYDLNKQLTNKNKNEITNEDKNNKNKYRKEKKKINKQIKNNEDKVENLKYLIYDYEDQLPDKRIKKVNKTIIKNKIISIEKQMNNWINKSYKLAKLYDFYVLEINKINKKYKITIKEEKKKSRKKKMILIT